MKIGVNKSAFFYSESSKDYIKDTTTQYWEGEVNEVIHRANLACDNTFIFTHRWDMERCETPISFSNSIDWTYQYKGDFEWTVNLNRARFMAELGQSYWLTEDEKYVTAFIRLMNDWLEQNPLTENEVHESKDRKYNVKDTWRKLDSGIRITNWIKGYYCVKVSKQWGAKEEKIFQHALALHGMYLHIAYLPHDQQSNWGFLETNGLFQIAMLFPHLEYADKWLESSITRLENMCKLQVFEDGMHNEQSPMYHHEVLHCLFECVLLAKKNNFPLPSSLESSLEKLFTASLAFVKPNGHQPMISDSDHTDIRDVLTRGAVLFENGAFKHQGYSRLDFEGIWYFGKEGFNLYEQLNAIEPSFCSTHFEQAGYSIMRSSWQSDAHYVLFDGGHMDIIRAHGHDDFLHFDLCSNEADFLIDTGRYTYMENDERRYFKESTQHNTISVDNQTISTYVDSWTWENVAQPVDRYWKSTDKVDYVQSSHNGYMQLESPVEVKRQLMFIKPYYWILVDTCTSNDSHEYKQHFHFSEDNEIDIEKDGIIHANAKNGAGLTMIPLHSGIVSQESCWISRDYNHKSKSTKITCSQEGEGVVKFITAIVPHSTMEKAPFRVKEIDVFDTRDQLFSKQAVTAVEVTRGLEKEILLFSHEGPNSFQFGGSHMTGEVLFSRKPPHSHEDVIKV
ncbi:alginate lyase family protein [Pontibacillus yanchengensis]|uniref:Heparinase n=1 Tax=Pontibacillus yanchengensis Y32 TaxID=1385514 RepID=A0A0A2TRK9_9BACI|nr:alginate lyase family protein [Pontibacillus yanchengensis]KGP71870.1 heparinase [Pontibacillus yanchengensis Y32]